MSEPIPAKPTSKTAAKEVRTHLESSSNRLDDLLEQIRAALARHGKPA